MRLKRSALGAIAAVAAFGAWATSAHAAPPNVLVVISDDQHVGTMGMMPQALKEFGKNGTSYSNAWATTPLCCPSRASIYSGKYAHNHGITVNSGAGFNADDTWQRHLHDSGYFTGFVGKYFNGTPPSNAPHFDFSMDLPDTSDETARWVNGVTDFLEQAENDDERPWALVVAPHSPHTPWTARPRRLRPIPPFQPSPAFGEADLTDKHSAVQTQAARVWDPAYPNEQYTGQMTELQAMDEGIGRLFGELSGHGESGSQTLAFYVSDNGLHWGDHRLYAKRWPYLAASHVPLYVRWPGHVGRGVTRDGLAANIDIAATIYEATGISAGYPVDGRSLLGGTSRDALLLEYPTAEDQTPPWSAYLSKTRHYLHWDDGSAFVEDYDLTTDPAELTASNLPDPAVEAWLDAARTCAGASCP